MISTFANSAGTVSHFVSVYMNVSTSSAAGSAAATARLAARALRSRDALFHRGEFLRVEHLGFQQSAS